MAKQELISLWSSMEAHNASTYAREWRAPTGLFKSVGRRIIVVVKSLESHRFEDIGKRTHHADIIYGPSVVGKKPPFSSYTCYNTLTVTESHSKPCGVACIVPANWMRVDCVELYASNLMRRSELNTGGRGHATGIKIEQVHIYAQRSKVDF